MKTALKADIPVWQTTCYTIALDEPKVMGIVNLTPDSFSDGGVYNTPLVALKHAEQLIAQGAHILDIGAESTRPGTPPVPLEEELHRLIPVIKEAVKLGVPISVDTYKPQVMQAVLDEGVDIINDVWALRMPGALDVIAAHPACGVCLMHMHGEPQTMQISPMPSPVVPQVRFFLEQQATALKAKGISHERIVLDYGIGFGKTVEQNFSLLSHQSELLSLGYPILAGWSRKSSIGAVTGRDIQHRTAGSVAAALLAVEKGARIVRVHDVQETADALKIWQAACNNQTTVN